MLNKLRQLIRRYNMLRAGDHVVCAVSGGADSVALLFGIYLLRENLGITLSAAHFNHKLRGEESDRDEQFVRSLCDRLEIPLSVSSGDIRPGKKGLEAAAREARYAFLKSLPGKIATAHTANDNLETVLMHLVRGTGLKGLGGIAPVNGQLIRPMLEITRSDVLAFLGEYNLSYVTDSSNGENVFLRNRLRMQVVPLLEKENPNLAMMVTALAQRLRQDEGLLDTLAFSADASDVLLLQQLPPALRSRAIGRFLEKNGVIEPEACHIEAVESLVFSQKPSARVSLRKGIVIARNYDRLVCLPEAWELAEAELPVPGEVIIPQSGMIIRCQPATELTDRPNSFTVVPHGKLRIRHRLAGDAMRLSGGTKELKKLFIDKKIPAAQRLQIPVIADEEGIVGVYGFGANRDRLEMHDRAVQISFLFMEKKEEETV